MNVSIINYGSGNVKSLYNAIKLSGFEAKITSDSKTINKSDKIILPGVGSFQNCKKKLTENIDLANLLDQILVKKKFFLGICVGMQIISDKGSEIEMTEGLKMISGNVEKINSINLPIPHVGWNNIDIKNNHKIFKEIPDGTDFYFTHSYKFNVQNQSNILATTNYSEVFTSIINKDNIFGVQFHPEKSQFFGIKFLKNFINL